MDDDRGDEDGQARMSMVLPLVACRSQGGPYDDEAFCAGFQAGEIHRALCMGSAARAVELHFPMVRSELMSQLDLLAMHSGFITSAAVNPDFPEWADVRFVYSLAESP